MKNVVDTCSLLFPIQQVINYYVYYYPSFFFGKVTKKTETKEIKQEWKCNKCATTARNDAGIPAQTQKMREFIAQRTWNSDPASFVRIASQQVAPLLSSLHVNHYLRLFYSLEMANALSSQKRYHYLLIWYYYYCSCYLNHLYRYDEAVTFMGQVCEIVTKIAPNTTQETDCLCQLAQIYAHLFIEASETEKSSPSSTTQKVKSEFAQMYRKATSDSLRVARLCLGEYHPHTIALSKTFAT